ncbi:hypothetical protein GCM10019016_094120 [Streptomyces prasinosporus]|uniref:Uncharacterized protein n=1 Tax=Streptomyces prasinosporus TaxID=68256 RepID=A0ABP6U4H9_9ACTN
MNLERFTPRVAARLVEARYPDGTLAGMRREVDCPFCGLVHSHGPDLGHRLSHCMDSAPKRSQHVDPRDAFDNPGYVLCDAADEHNWDVERLFAQLFVLRNERARLLAEIASTIAVSAREKRVVQSKQLRADGIAEILTKAGVQL